MVNPNLRPVQGSINLNVSPQGSVRTTANVDFSSQLRRVMAQGAATAGQAASTAAPLVPGAAVVSAVLSNAANDMAGGNANSMLGGINSFGGSSNTSFLQTMEGMQQNMMSMNMQMIGVQRQFQQISEQYTMVSNVMKTKHDTEKNAINNIR